MSCSYKWRMGKQQRQQIHDVYPASTPQEPGLTGEAEAVVLGVADEAFHAEGCQE